jgi:hypothetical protein
MFEGVGRRSRGKGRFLDIGQNSLNGYERNVLFRNRGAGIFQEVGWVEGADREEDGRGMAVLDADSDGRLDLVLRSYLQPAGLLHNTEPAGHWIGFQLSGRSSNRDAVGARIRLRSGGAWQTREVAAGSGFLSSSSLRQHFGLGEAQVVDEVWVIWPAGGHTLIGELAADRWYAIEEGVAQPLALLGLDREAAEEEAQIDARTAAGEGQRRVALEHGPSLD